MTEFLILLIKKLYKLSSLKLFVVFTLTFIAYMMFLKVVMGDAFEPFFSDNIFLILIIPGLTFVAFTAIRYLDGSTDEKENIREMSSRNIERIVSSQVKSILENIPRDAPTSIKEEEKEYLLNILRTQFESKISEEYYQDIKHKIKNEWLESEIDLSIRSTIRRLIDEVRTLKLRSNLNLVIGMILCFSGIIALFIFLQKNAGIYVLAFKDHNINEIILTLIPNAFFVLLIEIFSYFFLNLYKKSIEEIKFYQNELTNLESKFLALKAAKITNNHKLLATILEEIVKTERNFILQPGHSTIEIEKEKISSTNSSNVIKAATELLNFKK